MDVSQILPNLFVGTFPSSSRGHRPASAGVRHHGGAECPDRRRHGLLGRRLEVTWNPTTGKQASRFGGFRCGISIHDDLRRQLPKCVEVLDELLRQGHTVYVHCNMGMNRSPSIVIAYLHWVQGWDLEKATDHVMKCRSCDPYVDAIGLAGEDRRRKE